MIPGRVDRAAPAEKSRPVASNLEQETARAKLDRLQAPVLAAPELCEALGAEHDPDAFAVRLAAASAMLGEPLTTAEIAALLAAPPIGAGALTPPLRSCAGGAPPGWRPAAVGIAGPEIVEWVHLGGEHADGGFYYDEVQRALQRPFNRLFGFCSPLAELARSPTPPALAPSGLVFHMSHCGSTLVSRMLAAGEAHLSLGEPQPLDAALRLCAEAGLDEPVQIALVRGVAAALGVPRRGETRYFLKLDAWHVALLPLLRRAFPETPWAFVYREPLEVMAAQTDSSALAPWRLPAGVLGLASEAGEAPRADDFAATLAAICERALGGLASGGGLLVSYSELPDAVARRILPHLGVTPSAADLAAMALAATADAKSPGQAFTPDSAEKRARATPEARAAVHGRLADAYARLQAVRALET
jgi:hypothetical protein